MSLVLTYTSQTGVESVEPTIVEHVAPTRVRINDATYGLKTAAKTVHDKVAKAEWQRQKDEAIGRQRSNEASKKQAKIDAFDSDIAKIMASIITGTSSDPVKAKALVATLQTKRQALV
jgi:hypothetical protein